VSGSVLLIADDDEDILALVGFRMERLGYSVLLAKDGAEALEIATGQNPDMAILDVMMPEMDGHEVTRRIRKLEGTGHLPILLLTASAQDTDIEKGRDAGADDHLRKPFAPEELRLRVEALLAGR
jgi:CheY-like chemotaxis protein